MINESLRSQYKHLFQKEDFAFVSEETCLHNFSSVCQASQFRGSSLSLHRNFRFFGKV